ncbi:MAG: hypothetical protein ACREEM_31110 [Blastocatellia bacterium]
MIRPLRKIHRLAFVVLSVALVLLFVVALWVRRPAPITPRIPDVLLQPGGATR